MNLIQTIWRATKWKHETEKETGKDMGYWQCLGYFRGNPDDVRAFLKEAEHYNVGLEGVEPRDITPATIEQIRAAKDALGNAHQALSDLRGGV